MPTSFLLPPATSPATLQPPLFHTHLWSSLSLTSHLTLIPHPVWHPQCATMPSPFPTSSLPTNINTHKHASHHRPAYHPPPHPPPPSTPPFPMCHRAADRWLPERQGVLHLQLQRRRHNPKHLRLRLQRKGQGAPGLAAANVLRRRTRFHSVVRQGGHCLHDRPQVLRPY